MKQVLLINGDNNFRDFLKEKLAPNDIKVESGSDILTAFTKVLKFLPDLVVVVVESVNSAMPFLSQKRADPNAKNIPVIIVGPKIEKEKIPDLIQLGVVSYFKRPLKMDSFLEAIGKVLGITFALDTTPCVLNMHVSEKILFIEFAKGLNHEKITMMKHKIPDFLKDIDADRPKLVIMLTDMELSFLDAPNLELLLDSILSTPKVLRPNVHILSLNSFVQELVAGHSEYEGIRVVKSLSDVLGMLVKGFSSTTSQELISEKLLENETAKDESYGTRFVSESLGKNEEDTGILFHAAIVDDQAIFRNLLKNMLSTIGCETEEFESGEDFLRAIEERKYDLIILDIFMPGLSGLDVLYKLRQTQNDMPVIVYSQAMQKEVVVKSLQIGAKAYLVKPQTPETILSKCVEVLKIEGLHSYEN